MWLFLACDNVWYVHNAKSMDAREASGSTSTVAAVADGTLPHEVPAGGWQVVCRLGDPPSFANMGWQPQPLITVTAAYTCTAGRVLYWVDPMWWIPPPD